MSQPGRIEPAIVEFDDEGNAPLHLPAASGRRFLVDESPEGTFHLVPLLDDEELPKDLRARIADNEADPSRLVRRRRPRTRDPQVSAGARALIREITRGPDLARELAAQGQQDPDLAG